MWQLCLLGFSSFAIDYSSFAWCPCGAAILAAIALTVVAQGMPARTQQGAEAAAKWQAFRRYLQDIDKYVKQGTANAGEIFEKYLPYTIAFGFNNEFVGKMAALGTPAPSWYQMYGPGVPTYYPGYGNRYPSGQGSTTLGESGPGGMSAQAAASPTCSR